MGFFEINSLENCAYSNEAEKLMKTSTAKYRIKKVSQKDKEKYKKGAMKTFPQIYYSFKRKNKKYTELIGGLYEFKKILESKRKEDISVRPVIYNSVKKHFTF